MVTILNTTSRVMDTMVDSVSDVITLKPEQFNPALAMASALYTDYLIELGKLEECMLFLFDIDKSHDQRRDEFD